MGSASPPRRPASHRACRPGRLPPAERVRSVAARFGGHSHPWAVRDHFRDLHNVEGLAKRAGIEIRLVDAQFEHRSRSAFVSSVKADLEALPQGKIVLLDPDTGIAPEKYDAKHVTADEIAAIWACLGAGDWLVHYQHQRRTGSWLDDTREEFRVAIGAPAVSTFRGPKLAADVAFFAAAK